MAAGNNLAVRFPEVARGWAADLNGGKSAHDVSPMANTPAWWRCLACGSPYEAVVANRTRKSGTTCPPCSRKANGQKRAQARHEAGRNLAEMYPTIAAEMVVFVGEPPAKSVSPDSHEKRMWKCSTCGHTYKACPADRTRKSLKTSSRGCPACFSRLRAERNRQRVRDRLNQGHRLALTHPELCKEWHTDNVISPHDVTPGANVYVLWKGACGHSWSDRVGARTNRADPRGCPVCAGQAVSADRNFKARYPRLAEEWSSKNDTNPEDYSPGSNRPVKWQCLNPACGNEWERPIIVRVAGNGCPKCTIAHRSLVEIWIAFELSRFFKDLNPEEVPKVDVGGRTLRPDAVLSYEHRLLFEYDGKRYHKDDEKTLKRLALFQKEGWRVITARESPLPLIGDLHFSVDGGKAWRKPHEVAQWILRIAHAACGWPITPEAEEYLESDHPVARESADAFILSRRRRSP